MFVSRCCFVVFDRHLRDGNEHGIHDVLHQAARFEARQACCPRGEDEHACKAPSAERQGSDGRSAIKGAYTKAEAEQAKHK